jgi:hypothetical protein
MTADLRRRARDLIRDTRTLHDDPESVARELATTTERLLTMVEAGDALHAAAHTLAETFSDSWTAGSAGGKMTCSEAEVLASVIRIVDADAAQKFLVGHANGWADSGSDGDTSAEDDHHDQRDYHTDAPATRGSASAPRTSPTAPSRATSPRSTSWTPCAGCGRSSTRGSAPAGSTRTCSARRTTTN